MNKPVEQPMYAVVELITPELAARYLELNIINRPVGTVWVIQLSRMMAARQYSLHHQGIAFDVDGFLIDGQHRLLAIIRSGVAVEMMVTRNVPAGAQLTADDHKHRSAGDSLSLARRERVTSDMVSVMRAALTFGNGIKHSDRHTKTELAAVYDALLPALNWVNKLMPNRIEKGTRAAAVRAAILLAWFYVKDLSRLEAFVAILSGKQMALAKGERAAVLLREAVLRCGMRNENIRVEMFQKTQRAIKAFIADEHISRLFATDVYYPWPLVNPVRTAAEADAGDACGDS